jgi:hypothetical protein
VLVQMVVMMMMAMKKRMMINDYSFINRFN